MRPYWNLGRLVWEDHGEEVTPWRPMYQHQARMIMGLELCGVCFGYVDDHRHDKYGSGAPIFEVASLFRGR